MKYNYLPAYQTDIKAPLTPKPDCLHPTPGLTPPTVKQYAGIAYITLARLVDTMVPAAGPWALLAPLLWWALPSSQQSKLAAEANRPSPGTQYPGRVGFFALVNKC
ncbi:hypothetical protein DSO57_1037657 [Entomophthora muscae]|uniref:Uncharacterized protein n=1 Tax=Entomophthora muscae TaxID=34485 RepID=A0ACC2RPW2_9FUNG|nr:hypothetical protein DSO57_1037657 [Entomophthora muscae]